MGQYGVIKDETVSQEIVNKWIAFVKKETKADVSMLGIVEIEHLTNYRIEVMAREFPSISRDITREMEKVLRLKE